MEGHDRTSRQRSNMPLFIMTSSNAAVLSALRTRDS
jgi:hypothetical protein